MEEIPALRGTYLLHLRLTLTCWLDIGKLGRYQFVPGEYIYTGSAQGPGGLQARLRRHVSGGSRQFWHIDYLRSHARAIGYAFTVHKRAESLDPCMECSWIQALAKLPEGQVLVPGFGASDCHSGCEAHLVFFAEAIHLTDLLDELNPISGGISIHFTEWIG